MLLFALASSTIALALALGWLVRIVQRIERRLSKPMPADMVSVNGSPILSGPNGYQTVEQPTAIERE